MAHRPSEIYLLPAFPTPSVMFLFQSPYRAPQHQITMHLINLMPLDFVNVFVSFLIMSHLSVTSPLSSWYTAVHCFHFKSHLGHLPTCRWALFPHSSSYTCIYIYSCAYHIKQSLFIYLFPLLHCDTFFKKGCLFYFGVVRIRHGNKFSINVC